MKDIISRGWENFISRSTGPLRFRFILQPAAAIFLAVRAGLRDARNGRRAFLWSAISQPEHRRELLANGWKDCGTVFFVALFLDAVYQMIVNRGIYALEAVFTAVVLAVVPYALLRGPVNRLAKRRNSITPARQERREH